MTSDRRFHVYLPYFLWSFITRYSHTAISTTRRVVAENSLARLNGFCGGRMKIGVRSLSTYSVGADGDTIALDLLDSNENTVTLDMSVDQVGMLAMTLPKLIETALKRRFHD